MHLFPTSRRASGGHCVVQPANQLRHQFKPHVQWCRVNHSLRQPLRGIVVVVVAVSAVVGGAGGGSAGGGSVVELVVVMVEIIVVVVLAVVVAVVIIEVDIVDSVAVDILVAATAVVVVIVVVVVVIAAGTRFLHALTTIPAAAAIRALQCPTVLKQCQHTHGHFHLTVAGREIVLV